MENRRTFARLLSHMLAFLPVPHGKACGCCRAGRGSSWQTRKEVRNQRRQIEITPCDTFNSALRKSTYRQQSVISAVRIASLNDALPTLTGVLG